MEIVALLDVAVLRIGAVARVGPQAMQGPAVLWEKLALRLETGVSIPELRGEDEAAEGLDAAGVDGCRVGFCGAGEILGDYEWLLELERWIVIE